MSDPRAAAPANPETRRERSDIDVRGVAWLFGGLLLFIVVAVVSLGAIFSDAIRYRGMALTALPPEPRLQTDPPGDLRRYNSAMAERLATYGDVDRDKGIVHIPIDEAMKIVAEHGIPDWPGEKK